MTAAPPASLQGALALGAAQALAPGGLPHAHFDMPVEGSSSRAFHQRELTPMASSDGEDYGTHAHWL